jgi:Cytochrome c7 and related cytochrome c
MGRFRHAGHLLRVALLCAGGLAVFLVARRVAVPADFGRYGHYRAGALDDARARPVVFAGQRACLDCHSDVGEIRKRSRHRQVSCEICHGPLAKHASGDDPATPKRPDGRTACLTCHLKNVSKPSAFPQIVLKDHADEGACSACHQPHNPKIS